ncbi:MAG: type IV pilus assembly protein PilM [Candidatus Yanofskybacteria bacterium]|nr:type IV pilus assembly protein PilM [Candidatus Yanofskybacteria bacterium]
MSFSFFRSIKSKGNNIGIDIGTSSIKLVELEKRGGRFNLVNYGIFELQGDSGHTSSSSEGWQSILKLPDEDIASGIKELLVRAKISSIDVVASISSFSTFATVIEMPYVSNDDLARALQFEAKKYIPIPLDEVVLDWSIVGISDSERVKSAKPSTVEVFLAAVPKDETLRYQNIMKNAGLRLQALELENSSLIRVLLGNDLSPTVIVNIGGRSTSIMIVNRGYERVSHNYEIGGFEITKAIAQSLSISLEKAEELKRKFGLMKTDENIVNESMISLINMMIFETQKTISSYEESKKEKIANVILVGGLVNMPNFANYFKEKLGRDVLVGNSFSRLVYPNELEPIVSELSTALSVAIGLGMRDLE